MAKDNIITKEDSDIIANMIAKVVQKDVSKVHQESIIKLNQQFKKLETLLKARGSKNNLDYYSSQKGWSNFLYDIKSGASYSELFNICTDILDILRTDDVEGGYDLIVYSTGLAGGSANIYFGHEANIPTKAGKMMIQK